MYIYQVSLSSAPPLNSFSAMYYQELMSSIGNTNSTLLPEAIFCCLHILVFDQGDEICFQTFVHITSLLFELYGHIYCHNVLPNAIFVVYL